MPPKKRKRPAYPEIGDRIRELRGDTSHHDFAMSVGASGHTTSRQWCDGHSIPNGRYLKRIAENFSVSADWLLFGPPYPKHPLQSRTDEKLQQDVAAHVGQNVTAPLGEDIAAYVLRNIHYEDADVANRLGTFIRFGYEIDGEAILTQAVEVASRRIRDVIDGLSYVGTLMSHSMSVAGSSLPKALQSEVKVTVAVGELNRRLLEAPTVFRFRELPP